MELHEKEAVLGVFRHLTLFRAKLTACWTVSTAHILPGPTHLWCDGKRWRRPGSGVRDVLNLHSNGRGRGEGAAHWLRALCRESVLDGGHYSTLLSRSVQCSFSRLDQNQPVCHDEAISGNPKSTQSCPWPIKDKLESPDKQTACKAICQAKATPHLNMSQRCSSGWLDFTRNRSIRRTSSQGTFIRNTEITSDWPGFPDGGVGGGRTVVN